jgi:hypothetical protein
MAICPFAEWRPLPQNSKQARINPRSVILHSAVDGKASDLWSFFSRNSLESHFYVRADGHIVQYIDTQIRADANYKANAFAVSIETDDNGHPDVEPWSGAQVLALIKLVAWVCDTHGIPKAACPAWDKAGVGWHSMWGAPSQWTPARGKTCPGAARIAQIKTRILPGLKHVPVGPLPASIASEVSFIQKMNAAASAKPVLRRGDSGEKVKDLQRLLNGSVTAGKPVIAVDGKFGATTERWLKQYQRDRNIPADGIASRQTWFHLLVEALQRQK